MKKLLSLFTFVVCFTFLSITNSSAHVIVSPSQINIGALQTFTVAVPTEKDNPTVALRLLIPSGLNEVVPDVKPGWTIDIKRTADNSSVTELDWTNGIIPVDQRDEFSFSAQAPSDTTTLKWKAYQAYKDGSVVSWDQDPSTIKKGTEGTPYSKTQVIDDLSTKRSLWNDIKMYSEEISLIAIFLSVLAIYLGIRRTH